MTGYGDYFFLLAVLAAAWQAPRSRWTLALFGVAVLWGIWFVTIRRWTFFLGLAMCGLTALVRIRQARLRSR
jgi:hypothetical protein